MFGGVWTSSLPLVLSSPNFRSWLLQSTTRLWPGDCLESLLVVPYSGGHFVIWTLAQGLLRIGSYIAIAAQPPDVSSEPRWDTRPGGA